MTKIEKPEAPATGFGVNLKSTGIDKFSLEQKVEEEKINFRDQLKSTKEREEEKETNTSGQ